MLKYMANHTAEVKHFWASYMIAKRHGYEIPDISTWYDYLRMLERFGREVRSPKLIAPANLFNAHDEYVEKVNRQRAKERREADRQKAIYDDRKFKIALMNTIVRMRCSTFVSRAIAHDIFSLSLCIEIQAYTTIPLHYRVKKT